MKCNGLKCKYSYSPSVKWWNLCIIDNLMALPAQVIRGHEHLWHTEAPTAFTRRSITPCRWLESRCSPTSQTTWPGWPAAEPPSPWISTRWPLRTWRRRWRPSSVSQGDGPTLPQIHSRASSLALNRADVGKVFDWRGHWGRSEFWQREQEQMDGVFWWFRSFQGKHI